MDFGVARTIDHAVYTMLNAVAVILWRLDAACINIAMLAYRTQDWLTGQDGGVWQLSAIMVGREGLFGIPFWVALLTLAMTIWGLARIVRPLFPQANPVDLGKLFLYGAMSYLIISQGGELFRQIEEWRVAAGSYIYQEMSGREMPALDMPGSGGMAADEPLATPKDLDGAAPLQGWEAVSSSYFLANDAGELQRGTPPPDLLRAYCLYDANKPFNDQDEENEAGCSPRQAWDEWDKLEISLPITQVWGIPLPGSVSLDYPVVQEHPENRQLGIRQAQAGVARLALGPLVALFPLVEANISLMLALAASFIYLSLPIALMFGFFVSTEALVNRLLMQLLSIFIKTLILNGLVAVFLLLLMGTAVSGSVMAYLGLVGVGLIGGLLLTRFATETMKESLGMAMGAVSRVWMRAATTVGGESARRPAELALGVAKLAGTAATLTAAASAGRVWDMAEVGYEGGRRGVANLQGRPFAAPGGAIIPEPLQRLAQTGRARPAGIVAAAAANSQNDHNNRAGQTGPNGRESTPAAGSLEAGAAFNANDGAVRFSTGPASNPVYGRRDTGDEVAQWADQVYQSRQQKGSRQAVAETGQTLLGEELSQAALGAMSRHSQAETKSVLGAARQAIGRLPREQIIGADGRLTAETLQATRAHLDEKTAQAFSGRRGERDLAALTAAGARLRKEAKPEEFRQAVAHTPDGRGEQAAGRVVPRSLGLDPVAAGAHLAGLNRFARLSEQAGLAPEQRQQLLRDVQQGGQISDGLRRQLETARRQRGHSAVKLDELVKSAQALPETLHGPLQVKLPAGRVESGPAVAQPPAKPARQKEDAGSKKLSAAQQKSEESHAGERR